VQPYRPCFTSSISQIAHKNGTCDMLAFYALARVSYTFSHWVIDDLEEVRVLPYGKRPQLHLDREGSSGPFKRLF